MAKRMITPEQFADRWVAGMQRPDTAKKWSDGVSSVEFNPLERAANASDAYLAGCAAGDDKRKRKLLAYGQANWVQACLKKGAGRIGSGAAASKDIMRQAGSKLLPAIQQIRQMLPVGTSEGIKNERMNMFSSMMRNYGKTGTV